MKRNTFTLIEILGVSTYEIIAITVTFFLCRFYKNQTAFCWAKKGSAAPAA